MEVLPQHLRRDQYDTPGRHPKPPGTVRLVIDADGHAVRDPTASIEYGVADRATLADVHLWQDNSITTQPTINCITITVHHGLLVMVVQVEREELLV